MRATGFSVAATLACAMCTAAWASETITYTGTGTFAATQLVMPLASGGAAVHLSNDIVATIEPSESGFMTGDCAGLGHISADGEYGVSALCSFVENANDAFDIKATLTPAVGGEVEIIGGSGKWQGATGTGTIKARHYEGERGTFRYEFEITTP